LGETDEAGAIGVLAFGVEGIVRWIYEPIVAAIKDHASSIKAEDYCFFPLHVAVDDDHAETLTKIAGDLAASYDARSNIDAAVEAALDARAKLWDSLLARADAMPPPRAANGNGSSQAPPLETSKLYDAAAGSWVRTEPTCLSDFTGRQPIFKLLQPILDTNYGQATVLDLGCGEGYVARKLREMGAASVLGIDISAEMINKARQEEEDKPIGRLTYIVGDVANPAVAKKASDVVGPEGFDVVACVFVFNYVSIEDMYATMKAAYALLKPGGTFLFSVPHPSFQFFDRKKEPPFFFMRKDDGKGYFSGRDCPSEGFIYTTQGKALPVRCMHKCWSDYLESLNAAGFTEVPTVQELTVTKDLAAKGDFFAPLQEVPLHVAFMAKRPVYANPASTPIFWPVCTQTEDFYFKASPAVHTELAGALAQARRQGMGHDEYTPGSLGDLPAVDEFGRSIAKALYQDLGAVVFKLDFPALGCCGADGNCSTPQQEASAKLAYAIVSHAVGMLRNDRGKLFDVKDRGFDIRNDNVLFSASSQACTFHTDSTNKDVFPDVVGLLCIRPAACSGGESLVANAVNAYAKLQIRLPKFLVHELERNTTRDLIGTGFGGEDDILRELGRTSAVMLHRLRSNRFPVFGKKASASTGTEGLTFRYMRTWIESGHSRAGYRISPLLKIAMDLLDQELDNACMIQCTLNPGDVLYCNNHITAHARSAFENGPTQANTGGSRLLVRSWIQHKDENESLTA
jgi:SAM-dependent methyltransferase